MTVSAPSLPDSSSSHLTLTHPIDAEKMQTWHLNGQSWAGKMDLETYIKRERHLASQNLAREGGITYWVLVDGTKPPGKRQLFATCESLRKRGLVARAGGDGEEGNGEVEEVISHGIGSVFCAPQFRGKGYAQRMIAELAKRLDTWQQTSGMRTDFTVLYSDIGKRFYARFGWRAFLSSHIALHPVAEGKDNTTTEALKPRLLYATDLKQLCLIDEATIIKPGMIRRSEKAGKTLVCLIPDHETMAWHHAREEFAANALLGGRKPEIKGAYLQCSDGSRVWCIWSRFFGNESNTLNILRLAIEGEENLSPDTTDPAPNGSANGTDTEKVAAIAALLRTAQYEAAKWEMNDVQIWNPTPLVVQAARQIEPENAKVIHRDEESIASLRWHREEAADVEWVGNEKYGWC